MVSRLRDGELALSGLWTETDMEAARSVLGRVEEFGIETVRFLFVDPHGLLRGKAVAARSLRSVFRSGMAVPSTLLLKDPSGRTAFPVWSAETGIAAGPMQGAGDVLLVPRPETFRRLPWAPHSAWILCSPHFRDGTPVPFASDAVLRKAEARLDDAGMEAVFGLEVEFHVFEKTGPGPGHADTTMPPAPPATRPTGQGYQFLSDGIYDAAEPMLDEIRRAAEGLALPLRSIEIEMGPSQYEVTFEPAGPAETAECMVLFRAATKAVMARRGLHASFMSKPVLANVAASGWHIHQSVLDRDTGRNLFLPDAEGALGEVAQGWIAGLLTHAAPASLMNVPTVNGYKRYQPNQLAPNAIAWGRDNRGAMLRVLARPGDTASRVENRAPETAANPYFALAAQIHAGLCGVEAGLVLPPPTETPYDGTATPLPASLGAAIEAFAASETFRGALGPDVADYLLHLKRFEWDRYLAALSEWEQAEYFSIF
ncbi:glutamine synthetase family protein [Chachezhania sediminis]|uniref:glutamine synthetase family protein n=1 Tax=Chachezhania sediminis TaxID=2599291 RepID=UPI00131E8ADC|nr:glutamine synthetase family protein [Chachezhania sediminis]